MYPGLAGFSSGRRIFAAFRVDDARRPRLHGVMVRGPRRHRDGGGRAAGTPGPDPQ